MYIWTEKENMCGCWRLLKVEGQKSDGRKQIFEARAGSMCTCESHPGLVRHPKMNEFCPA